MIGPGETAKPSETASPSESARATTAAESRYRIRAANSAARTIIVIGLDRPAAHLVEDLAGENWRKAEFYVAGDAPAPGGKDGIARWFADVAGHAADLLAVIDRADVVFLLATAGEETHLASLIGDACLGRAVKTSGLIVSPAGVADRALSTTLLALRPFVSTLGVVADGEDAAEMLHALGA